MDFQGELNSRNPEWLEANLTDDELQRRVKKGDGFALAAVFARKQKAKRRRGIITTNEGYEIKVGQSESEEILEDQLAEIRDLEVALKEESDEDPWRS